MPFSQIRFPLNVNKLPKHSVILTLSAYLSDLKEFFEVKLGWIFLSHNKFIECKGSQVTNCNL